MGRHGRLLLSTYNLCLDIQVNLHQGGIEGVLLETMAEKGSRVERSTVPTEIELSQAPEDLYDPTAYAAKVSLRIQFTHRA